MLGNIKALLKILQLAECTAHRDFVAHVEPYFLIMSIGLLILGTILMLKPHLESRLSSDSATYLFSMLLLRLKIYLQ